MKEVKKANSENFEDEILDKVKFYHESIKDLKARGFDVPSADKGKAMYR